MSRRHLTFACAGSRLVGTLDPGTQGTGLLIVSGGNELRSGPWASQALLAGKVAQAGFPVFRYDRRGIGDSEGSNSGFTSSGPDIAAALAAFRAEVPDLARIVAYGNCDAASALMLERGQGCHALVLANPWTFDSAPEAQDPAPALTPQRLRAHYLRRLADPRAWARLLTGRVAFGGLAQSLKGAAAADAPASNLHHAIASGLAAFGGPAALLVAGRDRTGMAFLDHWDRADPRLRLCPGASHSFAEPAARAWLEEQILSVLRAV